MTLENHHKIVTIGGGTGSHVVLSGLKSYPVGISAVIGMFDDGGSTGVLRRELKVMPPGDVRQCLVALSEPGHVLKDLFEYRFSDGFLSGHSMGNIILSALEKNTGSMPEAIEAIRSMMNITHTVIPVTLQGATLCAFMDDGEQIVGQDHINKSSLVNRSFRLGLVPDADINDCAQKAIREADKIVINPGDLYTSILPNFLVKGMKEALLQSRAKIIYVANIMTIHGHTDKLSVAGHQKIVSSYLHPRKLDCIIYNTAVPDERIFRRYNLWNQHPVELDDQDIDPDIRLVGEDLIAERMFEKRKGDMLQRSIIRHDAEKLAKIIYEL